MENNNEKREGEERNVVEPIERAIKKLETALAEIKSKISDPVDKYDENLEKIKEKGRKLKQSAQELTEKYKKIDPIKQVMIVAGVSAILASIATVIGSKCSNRRK